MFVCVERQSLRSKARLRTSRSRSFMFTRLESLFAWRCGMAFLGEPLYLVSGCIWWSGPEAFGAPIPAVRFRFGHPSLDLLRSGVAQMVQGAAGRLAAGQRTRHHHAHWSDHGESLLFAQQCHPLKMQAEESESRAFGKACFSEAVGRRCWHRWCFAVWISAVVLVGCERLW